MWVLGAPLPPPGAGRPARLRFLRDYQLRWLAVDLLLLIVLLAVGIGWAVAVFAVGAVMLVLDIGWLTVRLRHHDDS